MLTHDHVLSAGEAATIQGEQACVNKHAMGTSRNSHWIAAGRAR